MKSTMRTQNKTILSIGLICFSMACLAGCASSESTVSRPYLGPKIAKPANILVYDFSSDLNEIPASSPLKRQLAEVRAAQSSENIELSKQLGAQIAGDLAMKIRTMGLPGKRALRGTVAKPGDFVLKGYFLTLDEGSTAKRMALGFGSGAAELKVTVEGYQMTAQGLKFLGSGEGEAGSGKTPGGALSLGVAIATANPVGIVVSGAMKTAGEVSGRETIQGASARITKQIEGRLQTAFEKQGWI